MKISRRANKFAINQDLDIFQLYMSLPKWDKLNNMDDEEDKINKNCQFLDNIWMGMYDRKKTFKLMLQAFILITNMFTFN